ncbi:MAG: MFS transporter [Deltaproteobacteria bacterium]|nr:MFS transporter [Deltaproteobacteria bacterium]
MAGDLIKSPRAYRWIIFWILSFGYILVYFHRLCPAVVAVDMMEDLNATGALTGFLAAAYFYPYAIMQLPAGLLSDSWGPRKTISFFFVVAFIGSLILGLSPSVFLAIAGRTLVGLGVAMLFVPTMKVLAEWFQVREFALMTGILMAMGGLGSLAAATPLVWLSAWIGWRSSFVAIGFFTLILALLVWWIVRDRPADMGWPSPASPDRTSPPSITLTEGIRKVLTNTYFWPLAIWFFFNFAVFFSFGGIWGGPYLIQVYGLSKSQAGRILSMMAIGMIVGSPMLSYFSNNIIKARKPVIVISSIIAFCVTAILAFYTDKIPLIGLYLICLVLGVFSSAIVVIAFTTNKELFPVNMAGTATGLVNLFPFAGGAVFQPLLGYVLERHGRIGDAFTVAGYKQAFFVLFLCGIIALASSLFLKETMVED